MRRWPADSHRPGKPLQCPCLRTMLRLGGARSRDRTPGPPAGPPRCFQHRSALRRRGVPDRRRDDSDGALQESEASATREAWRNRAAALLDEMKQAVGDVSASEIWQQVYRSPRRPRGRPKGARSSYRSRYDNKNKMTDDDILLAFDQVKAREVGISDWRAALNVVHRFHLSRGAAAESVARRIIRHHKQRYSPSGQLDKKS
jgi:hypothetical protein